MYRWLCCGRLYYTLGRYPGNRSLSWKPETRVNYFVQIICSVVWIILGQEFPSSLTIGTPYIILYVLSNKSFLIYFIIIVQLLSCLFIKYTYTSESTCLLFFYIFGLAYFFVSTVRTHFVELLGVVNILLVFFPTKCSFLCRISRIYEIFTISCFLVCSVRACDNYWSFRRSLFLPIDTVYTVRSGHQNLNG